AARALSSTDADGGAGIEDTVPGSSENRSPVERGDPPPVPWVPQAASARASAPHTAAARARTRPSSTPASCSHRRERGAPGAYPRRYRYAGSTGNSPRRRRFTKLITLERANVRHVQSQPHPSVTDRPDSFTGQLA